MSTTAIEWQVKTPATEEPLTLAEAKAYLEVGTADTDPDLSLLIVAARKYAEDQLKRRLMVCTCVSYLDTFPQDTARVPLPADVSAVASVTYRTPAGASATMAAADYVLFKGRFLSAPTGWPRASDVVIEFTAGLYANAAAVPASLKNALLVLLKNLWDNRAAILAAGELKASYPLVNAALADLALHEVSE